MLTIVSRGPGIFSFKVLESPGKCPGYFVLSIQCSNPVHAIIIMLPIYML